MLSPERNEASRENRNLTVATTSSGEHSRPSGTRAASIFRALAFAQLRKQRVTARDFDQLVQTMRLYEILERTQFPGLAHV